MTLATALDAFAANSSAWVQWISYTALSLGLVLTGAAAYNDATDPTPGTQSAPSANEED